MRVVFRLRPMTLILCAILLVMLFAAPYQTAHAAAITVNSSADNLTEDDLCTLREAITTANSDTAINPGGTGNDCVTGSGADTISFDASLDGTPITLVGSQLPTVTSTIIITGNGEANTIIQADANSGVATYRVFQNSGTLTLEEMTVRNGRCNGSCNLDGANGGGIYNQGMLTLDTVTLSGNQAIGIITSASGGAIYNTGTMTMTDSTLSGNSTSNNGGGIFNVGGTVTVTSSTLSGNSVINGPGGGIFNFGSLTITSSTLNSNSAPNHSGGGIFNAPGSPLATITNSTLSGNTASNGGGIANLESMTITYSTITGNSATFLGSAGGISGGLTTISNTIVAQQVSGLDCNTTLTSGGNNIESATSCGFTQPGDQQNVSSTDLNLGPLQNNGGPTETHALGTGSVAIDAGNNTVCAAAPVSNVDQRGVARGTNCDVGAFEVAQSLPDLTATKTNSVGGTATINVPFNWIITVQNTGSSSATFALAQPILFDDMPPTGATYSAPLLQNQTGITGTIGCAVFAGNVVECSGTGGPVIIGAGGSFQIVIAVMPTALGTLQNPDPGNVEALCIIDPFNEVTESNEQNNECANSVTVSNQPQVPPVAGDPALTKRGSTANATVGETVTWTLVVSNPHSATINNVVVNDPIPANFAIVSTSTTLGTVSVSGSTVTANVGTLVPGQFATITIVTTVTSAPATGSLCNTANAGQSFAQSCMQVFPSNLPPTGGASPQTTALRFWLIPALALIGVLAVSAYVMRRKANLH